MPKEQQSAVRAGLMAEGACVPLAGVSVEAEILGLCARVTIAQRYRNEEQSPIEAVYVFPIDEGAAVCGFEAVANGTHYVGEVLEREAAFEKYDDAMAAGHGAYLLDEERPDVFTASIGNLPPGAEVLVRLTYVTELATEGDAVRFALPTTVSPRYAPAEDRVAVGRSDAEAVNPPVGWRVPYGLDISVRVALGHPVKAVESPSHPISVAFEDGRAVVTLATPNAALDRDFVLLASPATLDRPAVFVERDALGRKAALVAFGPRFPADRAAAEVVFLVDRSGSMQGSSIEQVRNALQLCLRSLIPGCAFNIVGFGSSFSALFRSSRPYDDKSLREASDHVAGMDADLGGTEILPALQFVLEQREAKGLPRQVVVLTDGEVSNTDAVIELAKKHADVARVFTFGIGRGASYHLVRGLARAGRGAAEFVYPGERIEAKVMRQFGRLLAPALTEIAVDWGGAHVTQAPREVPAVFAGEPMLLYAFLQDDQAATVTLLARSSQGPVSVAAVLDPAAAGEGNSIAPLAARKLIRELEESPEWLESRGSRQGRRKESRAKAEIVRLATSYKLASRETSFVAIERRATPVEGEAQLRRIPVALTSGWGGADELQFGGPAMLHAPMTAAAVPPLPAGRRMSGVALRDTCRLLWHAGASAPPADDDTGAFPLERVSAARPFDALVRLQRADGTWDLTDELAGCIGIELRDIDHAMHAAKKDRDARVVWATVLALAWLEANAASHRREWQMLAEKASDWLAELERRRPQAQAWLTEARGFCAARF
jgi:Ca-activated chloride channel homolog